LYFIIPQVVGHQIIGKMRVLIQWMEGGTRGRLFESLREENRPHPENWIERKEVGLLGPMKSRLGSNLAVLGLKLGRTGAHLGPTTGRSLHRTWAIWLQLPNLSRFFWPNPCIYVCTYDDDDGDDDEGDMCPSVGETTSSSYRQRLYP
jgi:hypothetical protein